MRMLMKELKDLSKSEKIKAVLNLRKVLEDPLDLLERAVVLTHSM